jgi:lipoate-protein ligase A
MEPEDTLAGRRAWRLLVTEPAEGATNMAIDEAVLVGRQAGTSPPTVRFYAWAPPTVSLGYGQPLDRHVDVEACRTLGVGLVRRLTGGSAIYHDGPERELTYSVVASDGDVGTRDLLATYRWIGRALLRGLTSMGTKAEMITVVEDDGPTPAFCFARTGRFEIESDGRKLVGSAQRRQGGCFLQHGSVLLGVDEPRLRALFPTTPDPLSTLTTLDEALGRRPSFDECVEALQTAFEAEHDLVLQPGGLTTEETAEVDHLVTGRYATEAWLYAEGGTPLVPPRRRATR